MKPQFLSHVEVSDLCQTFHVDILASLVRKHGERYMQLFLKGLILAQNERWRRGLGMQVERGHVGSNISVSRAA